MMCLRNTTNNAGTASLLKNVTTTAYDDTTGTAGTTYYYFVEARNAAGAGTASLGDAGYRALPPPPPPPVSPPPVTASTPFYNTPFALPVRIQAEDFDKGADGVAYHDLESANLGGVNYRPGTGVDIQASGDPLGGGNAVGYVKAGEWLAYTINVGTAGAYNFDFRVASPAAGAQFHLEANGVRVTNQLVMPNTGGWGTWTTVTTYGVQLKAGVQVLKVVFDTSASTNYVGNFNWFEFKPA